MFGNFDLQAVATMEEKGMTNDPRYQQMRSLANRLQHQSNVPTDQSGGMQQVQQSMSTFVHFEKLKTAYLALFAVRALLLKFYGCK